jgi:hypothetical protein
LDPSNLFKGRDNRPTLGLYFSFAIPFRGQNGSSSAIAYFGGCGWLIRPSGDRRNVFLSVSDQPAFALHGMLKGAKSPGPGVKDMGWFVDEK